MMSGNTYKNQYHADKNIIVWKSDLDKSTGCDRWFIFICYIYVIYMYKCIANVLTKFEWGAFFFSPDILKENK